MTPRIYHHWFYGYAILSSMGGSRWLTGWEVFWWKLGVLTPRHFDRKYFGR